MAKTTFSGPVKSNNGFEGNVTGNLTGNVTGNLTGNVTGLVFPAVTTTALGDAANAINTTGKYAGRMVNASGIIYTADGAAAGDDWYPSDGGAVISPA